MVKVFISYARKDDIAPLSNPNGSGFVGLLYEHLDRAFDDKGRPLPELLRDRRFIEDGDQFKPLIKNAINASDLFVAVLSPNWMESTWCLDELKWFGERWRHEGVDAVLARIVVVEKRYLDPEKRPEMLQGSNGYRFYHRKKNDLPGEESVFWHEGEYKFKSDYDTKIDSLANYLRRRVFTIETAAPARVEVKPAGKVAAGNAGTTVFVAQPAKDMAEQHARLVTDLRLRGHTVVPDPAIEIPHDATAIDFIDAALASASLSVHLLGDLRGYAPEEAEPISKLQLTRAALRVAQAAPDGKSGRPFRRLIWAPKWLSGTAGATEPGKVRDPHQVLARFGFESSDDKVIGDRFGDFQQYLFDQIEALRSVAGPGEGPRIDPSGSVYVYHRLEDTEFAEGVLDALDACGVRTIYPVFDGETTEVDKLHQQYLLECSSYIVCWGAGASEAWFMAKSHMLTSQLQSLGRLDGFPCRAGAAGPPGDVRKNFLKKRRPKDVIDLFLDLTAYKEAPPGDALTPLILPASNSNQRTSHG